MKDSNLLFLYNSTRHEDVYFGPGRRRMFYDFVMSGEEKKALEEAGRGVERRLKQLARQHKQGLKSMLGRLSDGFDVEFAPFEKFRAGHMPMGINLKDKHVEVPLGDWGSGTQNRTQIMMVILQANRIKTAASPDDKITPIVVIEEPESFLHPSAQSEFGRLLFREYFKFLQTSVPRIERLSTDIEVVPYGGKDTLKNTLLVKFVLSQFNRVFLTYDLDAEGDVKGALGRLGMKQAQDFMPLGVAQPGKDCFEGLLPDRILSAVNGRETDLVMKLGSTTERRHAKERLKKLYLDEFRGQTTYSVGELDRLAKVIKLINARFRKKR